MAGTRAPTRVVVTTGKLPELPGFLQELQANYDQLGMEFNELPWFKSDSPRIGEVGILNVQTLQWHSLGIDSSVLKRQEEEEVVESSVSATYESLRRHIEALPPVGWRFKLGEESGVHINCMQGIQGEFTRTSKQAGKETRRLRKYDLKQAYRCHWGEYGIPDTIHFSDGNDGKFDESLCKHEVYALCTGITVVTEGSTEHKYCTNHKYCTQSYCRERSLTSPFVAFVRFHKLEVQQVLQSRKKRRGWFWNLA